MEASSECAYHHRIDIFLDGRKVPDAFYADDEKGIVWTAYRDVNGRLVPYFDTEPGAFTWKDIQVIRLTGKVDIRVKVEEGESEKEIREAINATSEPPIISFYAKQCTILY
jgi:hypothetical protein